MRKTICTCNIEFLFHLRPCRRPLTHLRIVANFLKLFDHLLSRRVAITHNSSQYALHDYALILLNSIFNFIFLVNFWTLAAREDSMLTIANTRRHTLLNKTDFVSRFKLNCCFQNTRRRRRRRRRRESRAEQSLLLC